MPYLGYLLRFIACFLAVFNGFRIYGYDLVKTFKNTPLIYSGFMVTLSIFPDLWVYAFEKCFRFMGRTLTF